MNFKLFLSVLIFGFSSTIIAHEEPHHPAQHPNATHHNMNNANMHHNVNNANFNKNANFHPNVNGVNAGSGAGGAVIVPETTTVVPVQTNSDFSN